MTTTTWKMPKRPKNEDEVTEYEPQRRVEELQGANKDEIDEVGVPTSTANWTQLNPNSTPKWSTLRLPAQSFVPSDSDASRQRRDNPLVSLVDFPAIKSAKRVVLVRHGQSTWNAEGRIQGSSNFLVLTTKGESQAETSRQMLLDDSFDVCFTSPLARSKRTAEIIWGNRKEPMIPNFDLREIDLYSFQGLLKHEGKEKFVHYPVRELWARARSSWDSILNHQSKSVLVVAHNAVNQALVATAIGLGTEYFRVYLRATVVLAGQESFRSITRSYSRGAAGALLVDDIAIVSYSSCGLFDNSQKFKKPYAVPLRFLLSFFACEFLCSSEFLRLVNRLFRLSE
ncbi:hypothetical protein BVRB_5g110230 [Beta vulgaris subsp. vulgaris]|uniref:Uncharacterized protein n=1 Tax=Beta vulgaris subsp. vulgaris TaxID=3555 RepID=A0A0J8CBN4_BETVV|nr:hypothetical protein BVRB_5g110230 [Beta vulgaris subsp. vulgaris]